MTDITDDTALTLNEACRIYFRDAIKAASLKAEHKRGRLHMVKVGRTYFVTPAAIREMVVKQWQDPPSPQRLYLSPKEHVWLIRDGSVTKRTGCSEADRAGAEKALAEYIALKFQPVACERDPARIDVAEVLTADGRERSPNVADPARISFAIDALTRWWSGKTLAQVRAAQRAGPMQMIVIVPPELSDASWASCPPQSTTGTQSTAR